MLLLTYLLFLIACCLVVRLGLGFGLDLVSAWLVVVMHTYLYYRHFALSLSLFHGRPGRHICCSSGHICHTSGHTYSDDWKFT